MKLVSLGEIVKPFQAQPFWAISWALTVIDSSKGYEDERIDLAMFDAALMQPGILPWAIPSGSLQNALPQLFAVVKQECFDLGLRTSAVTLGRIFNLIEVGGTWGELKKQLQELQGRIRDELASIQVIALEPRLAPFFEATRPIAFDTSVTTRYSQTDIAYDISEAGRCLALERSTACVFHLMRVVEHGLRDWATSLNVTFRKPGLTVEKADWNQLLQGIDEEIGRVRGHTSSQVLERYDYMYSQFNAFKNAFRNPVSHLRGKWTQPEAEQIWHAVKAFMERISR